MTQDPRDHDLRLELIRLEQEVQSLRFRLQVKDDALRVLNARLMSWEVELARRTAEDRQELATILGPVWSVITRLSRALRVLLPDDTRRGRWWKALYGRLVKRARSSA